MPLFKNTVLFNKSFDMIYYVYFFLSGFSFTNIHNPQDSRKRGRLSY